MTKCFRRNISLFLYRVSFIDTSIVLAVYNFNFQKKKDSYLLSQFLSSTADFLMAMYLRKPTSSRRRQIVLVDAFRLNCSLNAVLIRVAARSESSQLNWRITLSCRTVVRIAGLNLTYDLLRLNPRKFFHGNIFYLFSGMKLFTWTIIEIPNLLFTCHGFNTKNTILLVLEILWNYHHPVIILNKSKHLYWSKKKNYFT